jgi:hypothetical protein
MHFASCSMNLTGCACHSVVAIQRDLSMMKGASQNLLDIDLTLDTYQSVYRERLLEHLLIGELLKYSWLHAAATLEVSQPSIDRSGHDVVLEANGVTRHLQLKSSSHAAKTPAQMVHVGLACKPSGCVVWTRFDRSIMKLAHSSSSGLSQACRCRS